MKFSKPLILCFIKIQYIHTLLIWYLQQRKSIIGKYNTCANTLFMSFFLCISLFDIYFYVLLDILFYLLPQFPLHFDIKTESYFISVSLPSSSRSSYFSPLSFSSLSYFPLFLPHPSSSSFPPPKNHPPKTNPEYPPQ